MTEVSRPPGAVLYDRGTIARRVAALAAELDAALAGADRPPVLVGVMKGGLFFLADLARAMRLPVEVEMVAVRSYAGTASTGTVQLLKDTEVTLAGRDVVVVEDVVDTGRTTAFLLEHLAARRPRTLRLCALIDKPARREQPVRIDHLGFSAPDVFLVGYGLDLDERWRDLPDVHALPADKP